MKKKVIASLATLTLVGSLIGGATFALFTDRDNNANNTFSTGKVDIAVGDKCFTGSGDFKMVPGDAIYGKFEVTNTGNVDEWVKVTPLPTGAFFSIDPSKVTILYPNQAMDLAPGETDEVCYAIKLDRSAGNNFQDVTGALQFQVDAVQMEHNSNSDDTAPLDWE